MFTGLLNPENSRPISDIKKNNLSKKTGTKELNNPNISKVNCVKCSSGAEIDLKTGQCVSCAKGTIKK